MRGFGKWSVYDMFSGDLVARHLTYKQAVAYVRYIYPTRTLYIQQN